MKDRISMIVAHSSPLGLRDFSWRVATMPQLLRHTQCIGSFFDQAEDV